MRRICWYGYIFETAYRHWRNWHAIIPVLETGYVYHISNRPKDRTGPGLSPRVVPVLICRLNEATTIVRVLGLFWGKEVLLLPQRGSKERPINRHPDTWTPDSATSSVASLAVAPTYTIANERANISSHLSKAHYPCSAYLDKSRRDPTPLWGLRSSRPRRTFHILEFTSASTHPTHLSNMAHIRAPWKLRHGWDRGPYRPFS
ncbi:hypothetical protein F5Y13DRAFT_202838 [Hypoxylon sp. FL1857]|nr:hypothetical protein F5Y13DRAFT_202838 [Hypoxylon sp. FL1857]